MQIEPQNLHCHILQCYNAGCAYKLNHKNWIVKFYKLHTQFIHHNFIFILYKFIIRVVNIKYNYNGWILTFYNFHTEPNHKMFIVVLYYALIYSLKSLIVLKCSMVLSLCYIYLCYKINMWGLMNTLWCSWWYLEWILNTLHVLKDHHTYSLHICKLL